MTHRLLIIGLFAGVASAAVTCAAFADPPARVGRIAYAEGDVSFQPTLDQDWTYAAPNYPVTGGQAFWTGDNGRVELQVGGIEADLDSETELDVTSLHYGDMRLGLSQGSLSVDIRGMPVGGVTVSTPAGDVHLRGRGFYRVDVGAPQDDGGYPPAAVTVFQGEADAPGPQGFMPVDTGQSATLYAGYDPQLQDVQDTAIDDWARERLRDERWESNPPEIEGMTGAADLARYGDFVNSPEFGTVWFPRDVDPDWAPYREGRWAWIAPWGYTWIDDAPWGFAPFHYGRWARLDGRWAWIPGQANTQPVWAPALVTFIGGLGGALGWIPLAPDEVYQPPYTVSDEYFRRANVANVNQTTFNTVVVNRTVTNITVNNYHNAPAVTVMRADALRSGAPVREARAQVSTEAIARAPVVQPTAEAPPPARPRLGMPHPGSPATAAAPPPRLAATRAAIAAPNPGANHPPVIAGARRAPPPPTAAQGGPRPSLIAPAQARNPAAQHRQSPAAPGMSAPAASPSHPRSVAPPPPAADEMNATPPPAPRQPRDRPPAPPTPRSPSPPPGADGMNATPPPASRPPRDRPPAPPIPRSPSPPPAAGGMNATPPPAPRTPRDRPPAPSAPHNPSAPPAPDGMNATPPPAPRTPRDRPPAASAPRNPSAPPAPDGMNATPPPAPKAPHARPPSPPGASAGRPAAPAPTAGPPPSPAEAQARRKAAEKAAAAKAAQSPPGSPQPPHP